MNLIGLVLFSLVGAVPAYVLVVTAILWLLPSLAGKALLVGAIISAAVIALPFYASLFFKGITGDTSGLAGLGRAYVIAFTWLGSVAGAVAAFIRDMFALRTHNRIYGSAPYNPSSN